MKFPDPRTTPEKYYDIEQTLDDNRSAACEYKRKHKWHDLRINKNNVSAGGFGDGYCLYLDCEPDEFMCALIKLHQDYP